MFCVTKIMLHLFHGEHIEASRLELTKLKDRFKHAETIALDGKTASLTDVKLATETTSLFGGERLVIIENLLYQKVNKKGDEAQQWLELIQNIPETSEVVFWESKEVGKLLIRKLPKNIDIAVFKPDKSIFAFVESVNPKSPQKSLRLFAEVVHQASAELGFAMLARQMRLLITVKDLSNNSGLTPWQISKLTGQAQSFTLNQLLTAHLKLVDIDRKIKKGLSAFSLQQEIELWLISL
ncbi:hypothetical protein C4579_02475 [Candidatus Microgenomates bacterium]|nr:MAG: hypothetical protein C4579_02475 [Candidatus Microgenomates bacterium]